MIQDFKIQSRYIPLDEIDRLDEYGDSYDMEDMLESSQ
jgi:hypothetical protein